MSMFPLHAEAPAEEYVPGKQLEPRRRQYARGGENMRFVEVTTVVEIKKSEE